MLQKDGIMRPERFAASGTVMRDSKAIEASGVLEAFDTDEQAEEADLSWCHAWVDNHG